MAGNVPDLLIFDCDGVLVDSEPISVAVLLEIIGEAGVSLDEETAYRRFLGRSMATVAGIMHEEFGLTMNAGHLEAMRSRLYERFRRELKPIPGIAEALAKIGLRRCVASSSQPERIELSLKVTGLLESLQPHLYSASMVKHGKPAPDLFLHAARAMKVAPENCLVIEDSPAGIEAARRAGMRVFAFVGGTHAGPSGLREVTEALGPDLVFDDMRELPALLGHMA
ncbi:HAD-IA family hydrolase [Stappia sp. GBMRC 2046]|uniref:HAD-IA family hydrolase n=1 Tax=Stappia sediminis TaxID=2692190 RepID=A0A7X3S993_9HYPH|nr:HAD family hydrolase [Stappia sediminis]MXN66525.1 HAD-IA family hydrolase [Stappia sediminis]